MIHGLRPLIGAVPLSVPLAAGLLLAACAVVPEAPRPARPRPWAGPEAFLDRLAAEEGSVTTLRARASVRYEGPAGAGSVTQAIVLALPDRARLEALSPLGTAVLLVTFRGDDLTVYAPAEHAYGTGRATREVLGRLVRIALPPEMLLRLLAGLPPLPIRPGDPRVQLALEGAAIRVESVDGPFWQRVWSDPDGAEPARGELGEAGDLLLRYEFADRRRLSGAALPFAIHLEEVMSRTRLNIRYETARLNDPVEAGLFELPRPTGEGIRTLDLSAGSPR